MLVEYRVQGNVYTNYSSSYVYVVYKIMKRSTKQSIYSQVLLFGANGTYTALEDMKLRWYLQLAIFTRAQERHLKR